MSTALVRAQTQPTITAIQSFDDVLRLADVFDKSGFFSGEGGKQTPAQLVVKIMAGQEIGVAPFAAANGMHIIKGKCAPGANLIAAKIKGSGRYDYAVERMTDTDVVVAFYDRGVKVGVSQFTAADAAKAQTQNMSKFPRNMLFARAISNGVKWYCPDVFNGVAVYTPDEMGAKGDYNDDGEFIVIESELVQESQSAQPVVTHRTLSPAPRQPPAKAQPAKPATEEKPKSPFASADEALQWGVSQGCFRHYEHAKNAYNKLKEEHKPKTAADMFALWIGDVERRVKEIEQGGSIEGEAQPETVDNPFETEPVAA